MVIALIGSFIVLVLIDMRGLLKVNDKSKTIIVYFLLIAVGFVIGLIQIIDIELLNPSEVIRNIVDVVLGR